jgi:hypothetical protein
MSDELNMDAERAEDLAAFKKWKGYELPALNNHGQFHQEWLHREFVAFCAGRRRTAPSAPMGEELPPADALVKRSEWDDAKAKRQSFNGWRLNYGDCDMSLFTENTVRNFVAPYAERIRQLQRELAERKTASIDRAELRRILNCIVARGFVSDPDFEEVIAYVDGRTAGAANEARRTALEEAAQWLDSYDGKGMRRAEAIRALAAAPTPMNSGKEEGK